MKTILLLLLSLASLATAQNSAVTKNAITGEVNGDLTISADRALTVNGTLTTSTPSVGFNTATPLTWNSVTAQASVQAGASKHGLLVRAGAGTANAIIGWSSSGGVAGKFYQDTSYTAPAVYVGRAATNATTATLEIGAATGNITHTAIQVTNIGSTTPALLVSHNGGIVNSSSTNNTIGGVQLSNNIVTANQLTATTGNISAAGTISGQNHPANVVFRYSAVAPNENVTGDVGDICIQVTSGTGTLHFKATGASTNTGWVAK